MKIVYKLLGHVWVIVCCSCLLSSCDNNTHLKDLKSYVEQLKADAVKAKYQTPINIIAIPKPVLFKAKNSRSPFDVASSDIAHGNNPLELYPLGSLRFKGTISKDDLTSAYIMTPENKVYQIKIGDIIGDHYGRITHIYSDRIEVEEALTEGPHSATRIVTLQLKGES